MPKKLKKKTGSNTLKYAWQVGAQKPTPLVQMTSREYAAMMSIVNKN